MPTNLHIFRHPESLMNTQSHLVGGRSNETPITERGELQAEYLGKYLFSHRIKPDRVFTSPAIRTLHGAKITLEAMGVGIEPKIVDALQELDQGNSVGRPRIEVYTPDAMADLERQGKDFKLPGGESMNEVGARMLRWVDDALPVTDEDETIFVFSHKMAISCLISEIYGWSRLQTYELEMDNTAQTLLKRPVHGWQLEYLGITPHLKTE